MTAARSRRTFEELRRTPYRGRSGPVAVSFVPKSSWSQFQVAYAIGRRVGNAVVRNRLKRQLRAIMAEQAPTARAGGYLVRIGPGGPQLGFDELKVAMSRAMEKATTQRSSDSPRGRAAAGEVAG
jgi:ribonuclease P protein component